MPCIGGPSWSEEQAEEKRKKNLEERYKSMLCSACRALERMGYDFDENPALSEWWDAHKREDAAKLAKQQQEAERKEYQKRIVREALAKPVSELTEEEKALLKKHNFL